MNWTASDYNTRPTETTQTVWPCCPSWPSWISQPCTASISQPTWLQRVQNILARVVVGAPWTSSTLNTRRDLHWLPVGHRITYKLCLTTWKTLHTSQPLYLSELISHYLPSRSLRSSNTNLLTRPPGIASNFSSRAFSLHLLLGTLPAHIRSIDTLSTFKRHLNFHLFQSAVTV